MEPDVFCERIPEQRLVFARRHPQCRVRISCGLKTGLLSHKLTFKFVFSCIDLCLAENKVGQLLKAIGKEQRFWKDMGTDAPSQADLLLALLKYRKAPYRPSCKRLYFWTLRQQTRWIPRAGVRVEDCDSVVGGALREYGFFLSTWNEAARVRVNPKARVEEEAASVGTSGRPGEDLTGNA